MKGLGFRVYDAGMGHGLKISQGRGVQGCGI